MEQTLIQEKTALLCGTKESLVQHDSVTIFILICQLEKSILFFWEENICKQRLQFSKSLQFCCQYSLTNYPVFLLSLQNAWRQITFFNNEAKTSYHSIQCQSNIRNIKKKYLGISIRLQYVWPLCVFDLISNWEIKPNMYLKTSSKEKNTPPPYVMK